ncbi:uncharacterized protein MONBRDRAFT_24542 [Monosiga brevicollis MX1]|uniref:Phosphoglycerate mutase family protein n=1 Tax=Monosiga brevicollis TaxID=81824 RepID=A9UWR8_MONBE|nr:uncharacterized protein MONBRDRAFT_24542 [Monosiga brevicollis MX1]EDQ90263.1 predicted protein [Monosiga brevicollis MX1]|eukprot:XP_001745030.1 hypothetical protein [Monosiga brevicollis MX1]
MGVEAEVRAHMEVSFVRHGEGYHNLAATKMGHGCTCLNDMPAPDCPYINPDIVDPALTSLGEDQARANTGTAATLGVEHVYCSTLQRAIQTALLGFEAVPNVRFMAIESAREQSGMHHCDQRRTRTAIHQQFPDLQLEPDLPEADELWKTEREPKVALAARCTATLRTLAADPSPRVALVTHSSFLLTLFQAILVLEDVPDHLRTWFSTGEVRTLCLNLTNL